MLMSRDLQHMLFVGRDEEDITLAATGGKYECKAKNSPISCCVSLMCLLHWSFGVICSCKKESADPKQWNRLVNPIFLLATADRFILGKAHIFF